MQFRCLTITADRYDDVIAHLLLNFYVDEPLNKSIGTLPSYAKKIEYARATMAEGVSVMAVDEDNQIVSVGLNGISRPGDCERALAKITEQADDVSLRIRRLIYEENIKLNLFKRLQCDRIFELRIGSMARRYRGLGSRGLGRELMMLSYRHARESGALYVKSEASSIFSQQALLNLYGFKEYSEIRYAELRTATGELMFPSVEAPHLSIKILIKKLDATEAKL